MLLSDFKESLKQAIPPVDSLYLQSLWYDAKNNWTKAHDLVDHLKDKKGYLVHAYLHRKEGDVWNADYWYSQAEKKRPAVSLEEEWEQLAGYFLEEHED